MARRAFHRDDHGMALTEYLILLALLTAGAIGGVGAFGGGLANAWAGWANFMPQLGQAPIVAGASPVTTTTDAAPETAVIPPVVTAAAAPDQAAPPVASEPAPASATPEPVSTPAKSNCLANSGGKANENCAKK